jgi:hypothetical protein
MFSGDGRSCNEADGLNGLGLKAVSSLMMAGAGMKLTVFMLLVSKRVSSLMVARAGMKLTVLMLLA